MGLTISDADEAIYREQLDGRAYALERAALVASVRAAWAELDATRARLAEVEAKRAHETQHLLDCCAARDKALAAAEAANARLREWCDEATDFLDELWKAFPAESATYFGANALLNEWKALAATAPGSCEALAEVVKRAVHDGADWQRVHHGTYEEPRQAALAAIDAPPQRTVEEIAADVDAQRIAACTAHAHGQECALVPKSLMDELAAALRRGKE